MYTGLYRMSSSNKKNNLPNVGYWHFYLAIETYLFLLYEWQISFKTSINKLVGYMTLSNLSGRCFY